MGISLSRLAGSVAACGGVGVISTAQIGWREPDFRQHPFEANYRAIEKGDQESQRDCKGGIIGVNIMVATQRYEEYVKTAVKAGVGSDHIGSRTAHRSAEICGGHQNKDSSHCILLKISERDLPYVGEKI